jgi:hypothetical protein
MHGWLRRTCTTAKYIGSSLSLSLYVFVERVWVNILSIYSSKKNILSIRSAVSKIVHLCFIPKNIIL